MQSPQTTQEVLELTIDAWAAFERELADLGAEELLRPGTVGDWSLRDLLAHLDGSTRWIAGQLNAIVCGKVPDPVACFGHDTPPGPEVDMRDNEHRNQWFHAQRLGWTLAQVREEYARAIGWFLAGIARVPDAEWTAEYTIAEHGWTGHARRATADDGWHFPLVDLLAGYAWRHFHDHAEDVRQARQVFAS